MTQPTPEAYTAASRVGERNATVRALVDAVWPLALTAARDLIAAEIRAHADKTAPADGNLAQRRLRRHLLIAERVAAGPISREQVVEAINERYRDHQSRESPMT